MADEAERFAGVQEARPRADLLRSVLVGVAGAQEDFAGGGIEGDGGVSGAGPSSRFTDGGGKHVRRGAEAHSDGLPRREIGSHPVEQDFGRERAGVSGGRRDLGRGRSTAEGAGGVVRRGRCAGESVDERATPAERDRNGRECQDNQYRGGPQADDVVPVKLAGFRCRVLAEPDDRGDGAPRPAARHPQVESRDGEEGEGEVADAGDEFAARAALLAVEAKVAVEVGHGAHERREGRRVGLANFAGVRIDVKGGAATGHEGDRSEWIRGDDEALGAGLGLGGAEARAEFVEREAGGTGGRRGDLAGVAFGPCDELLLEGEDGAGEAHDCNDEAGDEPGDEVDPEHGLAKHGTSGRDEEKMADDQKRVVRPTRRARGEPGVMFVLLCAEAK